jgi:hypothetical protein
MRRTLHFAALIFSTFVGFGPAASSATDTCDQKFTALNERLSAAYINLDAECYPKDSSDVTSSCGFQISLECQERYDALAQEGNDVYNELYLECSEFLTPVLVDDKPSASSPRVENAPRTSIPRPVVRAPTKKEMLVKIKSLKKQLKREQAKSKKLRKRCGK